MVKPSEAVKFFFFLDENENYPRRCPRATYAIHTKTDILGISKSLSRHRKN
jgi:hypothetical protein